RGAVGEAELLARGLRAQPGRGGHADQPGVGTLREARQQHGPREVARADEPDAHAAGLRLPWPELDGALGRLLRRDLRVCEDDAQERLRVLARDDRVRLL